MTCTYLFTCSTTRVYTVATNFNTNRPPCKLLIGCVKSYIRLYTLCTHMYHADMHMRKSCERFCAKISPHDLAPSKVTRSRRALLIAACTINRTNYVVHSSLYIFIYLYDLVVYIYIKFIIMYVCSMYVCHVLLHTIYSLVVLLLIATHVPWYNVPIVCTCCFVACTFSSSFVESNI